MDDLTKIIYDLELSLLQPETRFSRDALDRLLADDFLEFGSSGNKYTKHDILERLPNTTEKIEYVVRDFKVEAPSDDMAVATFITERTMNGKDKTISSRTSHWRNNNGQWQIFFHEGILIG